jgi:prepilin-type N-terminal cleavage/methylation domain-containing protein
MRRRRPKFGHPDLGAAGKAKGGYTLIEMLIVLAIMALAVAIVAPRGEAMLDQMTEHAVFFDFQRQMSDLRREAYASQTPVAVRAADDADPRDASARVLALRSGWTYRLDRPIEISAGGLCTPAAVEVLKAGQPVMHLTADDAACHFIRLD